MNNPRRIHRHLVKAFAAGALLAAAALPLAIASVAGAADSITSVVFTPSGAVTSSFGTGASGTYVLNGSFAGDGGNTAVTTTAPGVTFTVTTNTNTTTITGSFSSTSASVAGNYGITVTDNGGTATANGIFTINAPPSATSVSPSTGADTVANSTISTTVTGSGFVGTPTISLTSTVDGTSITATSGASGGTTLAPASSLAVTITPENPINHAPATPGTYTMTVTNPDGGSTTSGPVFTIVGNEIASLSPSGLPIPGTGSTTSTITVAGGGFQSGALISLSTATGVTMVPGSTNIVSGNTATFQVTVASTASAGPIDVTISNTGAGDNGATYKATGALGIGQAGSLAPIVTASSLTSTPALVAGAAATTVTFTGTGFSQYTDTPTPSTSIDATGATDADATVTSCINGSTGTSITCVVTVLSGTTAGPHTALLENGTAVGGLPNSFTVDGPAIASAAPAALAVGAPIGTVIALTGTGFNNTTQGFVTPAAAGPLAGSFQYASATGVNFVVTTPPTIADNGDTLSVYSTDAYGAIENSAPFAIGVDPAPTVSSITYATGTSGVGVGATAQPITINGTGLQPGATVTAFANGTAVADASVTATVTAVNLLGTQLSATIAIATGDANTVVGYKVTNPDGGVINVAAVAPAGLTIDAGPSITAVSPTPVLASATNAITITGTGFAAGAVVTATSNATCGTATVTATSIAVSCTFGVAQSTDSALVVTNADGGSATSATVLPAAAVKHKAVFRVTGVHGHAVAGHTVRLTITGTGFYGAPKITSNLHGTRAVVTRDTGKLLVVKISTPRGAHGTHVLTVRLKNGKSAKAHYGVAA